MNLEQIDTSTTAGKAEENYELSLAASLRQLAEAQWTLSDEPMPEDARQVLLNAAGMLAFNRHHVEAGIATIRLQSQFIKAMGNEMRAAGCDFDPASGKVVNTLANTLRADLAGEKG
ncbi:hypothetical protein [Stenotrophomonas muris]|uniref:hypothetical protein n=1 Tax=Stenotrophomonas muris TaxID=2963283 RepID=UPI00383B27EE